MSLHNKNYTVEELREALEKYPSYAKVWIHGCDCCEESFRIEHDLQDNTVNIGYSSYGMAGTPSKFINVDGTPNE